METQGYDWTQTRQAYADAAGWYQAVLGQVGGRWQEPGLGEWDVRALAGHTSRSLILVEAYLAQPPAAVEVESPLAYYLAAHSISSGPGVVQRGRDAGRELGDDPPSAVATTASRVRALVDGLTGAELLTSIVGGMRLADFLPTRVLELTVHTADLAVALGLPTEPPPLPAAVTLRLVSELAVANGGAGTLMLAATGRRGFPDGFSVL